MTNESYAEYLNVAARTVAYWKERPDTVPKQRMQSVLDTGLERASDQAKALFARLAVEARSAPGIESGSAQGSAQFDTARDADGSSADSGQPVALLDKLIDADIADRGEVARASWLPGTAPTVITGYLFSLPAWHREREHLIAAPSTAAARIRAVAQHLMDIDFQFGGGYVRRMLLSYFQSEIVPLLREPHPEGLRREVFSAAAEVAQLPGFSFAEPVFA